MSHETNKVPDQIYKSAMHQKSLEFLLTVPHDERMRLFNRRIHASVGRRIGDALDKTIKAKRYEKANART